MIKKLLSFIIVFCMVSVLALNIQTTAYATSETTPLNDAMVEVEVYNIEGTLGTNGDVSVRLVNQDSSKSTLNLSECKFVIERLSDDSNIVLNNIELSGLLASEEVQYKKLPYTIPEEMAGDSLEYKVKLVSKNDESIVYGESNIAGIYPYEIKDNILTYFDSSKGKKYLMKVEKDDNIDYWGLTNGGFGNASTVSDENGRRDYYLDPENPSVVNFSTVEGYLIDKVEVIPSDAGTATKVEDGAYGSYEIKLNAPATIKVTTGLKTEVKDWQEVVNDYITYIRFSDWFTGDGIKDHYFTETAPSNDIAAITYYQSDILDIADYNSVLRRYEIPYDEFIGEAKKHFVNVPSLKDVNIKYVISYDAETNCMIVPDGGIGNPMLITEFTDAEDLGQGRYALHFKVSKEEWDANYKPDMNNKDEYNECTLVVEDNGENNWRYISFTEDSSQDSDSENLTVVEQIEQAPAGSSVNVLMEDTTVVTKDILTAAKGKDVDVVLEMDGYSWTINGKDIDEVKDVDLKVILDTEEIPEDKIKDLAGDKKTRQLSLVYDGDFGFSAQLKINVGKDYAKQYGNLYWYNDNKLTFVDAGQVDENGNLSLTFNHASDYVIVFDKEAHDKKAVASTQTGDTTTMMAYAVTMVLSVLGLMLLKKRYMNH